MLSNGTTTTTTTTAASLHPILEACRYGNDVGDGWNSSASSLSSLDCVVSSLSFTDETLRSALDFMFLLFSMSLVFLMQAGFAMLCAGSVRLKNVQNTMLKNLLDACGAAIGFWSFGYAFAYSDGGNDFIGGRDFALVDASPSEWSFWLFQFAFAATCATIVAGTLAERCQMGAYLCYSLVLTGFVYPVVVRAVWSERGFLNYSRGVLFRDVGMLDFAGSGVVHVTGGVTALLASWLLGPRKGRFRDRRGRILEVPKPFPGHSPALQVLGTFILWFGWYGFNAGSIISVAGRVAASGHPTSHISALAAVNTTLAASAGCVTALFTKLYLNERTTGEATFDLVAALNGTLSGLVAITAGCAFVRPWASIVVGVVAGWIYLAASRFLVRHRVDDAVDAVPVHLFNGLWGVLAVGLFAAEEHVFHMYGALDDGDGDRLRPVGLFHEWERGRSDGTLLAAQIVGACFIVVWTIAVMSPFFVLLNYFGLFRADDLEEVVGLDVSYHGGMSSLLSKQDDLVDPKDLAAFRESRSSHHSGRHSSHHSDDLGSFTNDSTHSSFGSHAPPLGHWLVKNKDRGNGVVETRTDDHYVEDKDHHHHQQQQQHPVLNILGQLRQIQSDTENPPSDGDRPDPSHHSISENDVVERGALSSAASSSFSADRFQNGIPKSVLKKTHHYSSAQQQQQQ